MTDLKTYVNNIDEKLVINKDLDAVPASETEPTPAPRTGRGVNTVLGKNAARDQEKKMDAWHNGTRKQNVGACSDAKLKLNYKICKDKGYHREASLLKAEAQKRGIVIESLEKYVNEEYYDTNEYYNDNLFVTRNYNV